MTIRKVHARVLILPAALAAPLAWLLAWPEAAAATAMTLCAFLAWRLRAAGRELARAEERLGRAEARMRKARGLEAVGRLAGRVAHDFNNILTAINGYAELAAIRLPDKHPSAAMLEEIRKAGDRAGTLTERLLAFSRRQHAASGIPEPGRGPNASSKAETAGIGSRFRQSQSAKEAARTRETVMVVEDDENARRMAASVLRAEGYDVLEASGSREAMFLHEQHPGPIHILLTDVIMPGRSGRELALDLQRLRPGIRTIFMSGYTGDDLLRQGLESSRALFLGKPFTPAQLVATLAEAESLTHAR